MKGSKKGSAAGAAKARQTPRRKDRPREPSDLLAGPKPPVPPVQDDTIRRDDPKPRSRG